MTRPSLRPICVPGIAASWDMLTRSNLKALGADDSAVSCNQQMPPLESIYDSHAIACHYAEPATS